MLEVTLLKVLHQGVDEARKLLPFIQQTDVFSPEFPGFSERDVETLEKEWEQLISSGISRSEYDREAERFLQLNCFGKLTINYIRTLRSYLFRSKIPLWHLGRLKDEDMKRLFSLKALKDRRTSEGFEFLHKGEVETFLKTYEEITSIDYEAMEMRDRNIAENIANAEDRIRERFPGLKRVEPLRLTAFLGACHSPERYSSFPIKTHLLDSAFEQDEWTRAKIERRPFKEHVPHILRYGALYLIEARRLDLTRAEVEKMSPTELYELLKR